MQSKGAIKLLAVLLALACVYQLSFTFKTRSVEKKASEYAAQFPLDQQGEAEQHYLDSVQNLPVYNLGFRKFTYKECKEKELNLGLDLKGGMNVMLEVQVEDVVKALAGDSQNDPAFIEAIGVANEAMKQGSSTDYISDFVKAYSRLSNGRPIAELFVSPDRKDITLESSDADVEKILKKETEAAIGASFNVLRSRIDQFGVVAPNIQELEKDGQILLELPGVKEHDRVRELLKSSANLEFYETMTMNEWQGALAQLDAALRADSTSNGMGLSGYFLQMGNQYNPIVVGTSTAANRAAMDWFQRYYPEYRVHAVNFPGDPYPIHIDATFVPLRPGLIINNPHRHPAEGQKDIFEANDWQIVDAAQPAHDEPPALCYSSVWLSMNCLVLDPSTVIVEASEVHEQEQMDQLGMNVIPVDLRDAYPFGGGLHCSTADVYREGECLDYFPNRVKDCTLIHPEMWEE